MSVVVIDKVRKKDVIEFKQKWIDEKGKLFITCLLVLSILFIVLRHSSRFVMCLREHLPRVLMCLFKCVYSSKNEPCVLLY